MRGGGTEADPRESVCTARAPIDPILLLAVVDAKFSTLSQDARPGWANKEQPVTSSSQMEWGGRTACCLSLRIWNRDSLQLLSLHLPTELKRKYKRFCKRASEEYNFSFCYALPPVVVTSVDLVGGSLRPPQSTENKLLGRLWKKVCHSNYHSQLQPQQAVLLEHPRLYDIDLEGCMTSFIVVAISLLKFFLKPRFYETQSPVPVHEDPDRLHKAQAMYAFTEVSILEFDLLECQPAKRERERYDDDERANGLELDIDPVKLERRLKRWRSEAGDDASTDSHASEERDGKGRESKRSKRAPGALDGQQHIDELNPSPVPSPGPQLQQQH
ncbi:hypothetical protein M378DRAFT_18228 [Amanita muscaria Koide BX008]|uniref:Uncharacterized protein n=1 Tax=Amanita muscaria (strain Koide BX008) TaxID=946122 RepID=A0A0C2RXT5_AMAMK|nr:hypothetical protein M378DRAFT_18228 [Amanita muscaria Koide BX008]